MWWRWEYLNYGWNSLLETQPLSILRNLLVKLLRPALTQTSYVGSTEQHTYLNLIWNLNENSAYLSTAPQRGMSWNFAERILVVALQPYGCGRLFTSFLSKVRLFFILKIFSVYVENTNIILSLLLNRNN